MNRSVAIPPRARRVPTTLLTVCAALSLVAAGAHGAEVEPLAERGEVVVVPSGHLDVGPRLEDGRWELRVRDDREHPPVWRALDDVVVEVVDEAVLPVPSAAEYAFLDVPAGEPVHVIPQVEREGVVWVGWNTQAPEVVERLDRGADLSLVALDGPGDVYLFLQEGVSSQPLVLWDSTADLPQSAWMEVNTHTHANWVFTAPGAYLLGLESSGALLDGTEVTATATLRVAVGPGVDTAALLAADLDPGGTDASAAEGAAEPADGGSAQPGTGSGTAGDTATAATVLPWLGVAAVVLAGVALLALLRGRRARARAEQPAAGPRGVR